MSKPAPDYVELDTHKDSIAVAHAEEHSREAPVYAGPIGSRDADVDTIVRRLQSSADRLVFAHEARYVPVR